MALAERRQPGGLVPQPCARRASWQLALQTVFVLYGAGPTVVGRGHGVYSETCSEANILVELGEIPSLYSGQALRCSFASLRTLAQDDSPKFLGSNISLPDMGLSE